MHNLYVKVTVSIPDIELLLQHSVGMYMSVLMISSASFPKVTESNNESIRTYACIQ